MTEHASQELPDLSGITLETLRMLDHAVLRDIADRLIHGQDDRTETLWGFTNSVPQ